MNLPLIRKTFTANGIFSFVVGLILAIDAGYAVSYFGWPQATELYLQITGIACAVFGVDLFLIARSEKWLTRYMVKTVFYLDIGWVLATPVLLALLPTTAFGIFCLLLIAAFVGTFAFFEYRALSYETQPA